MPNRDRPELAALVGPVANPLPIRTDCAGTGLHRAARPGRDAVRVARAHQDLPFARLAEVLHLDHD